MQNRFSIAIHGGAGTIDPDKMTEARFHAYEAGLKAALEAGAAVLSSGGSALNAVEEAVKSLEDCPLFNAGKGAVYTNAGTHEMDASIMDGRTREAGAVAGISRVRNPIALARMIKEKSGHVFLCGPEAERFAQLMDLPMEEPAWFDTEERYKQWQAVKDTDTYQLDHSKDEKKFGTVGAVALDRHGNLAAATSTGGMTNKRFGRVGDTPVIGAGTYANNNTCAVSCTGHGEFFLRAVVAYDISCLMEYKGLSLQQACDVVVKDKLVKLGGEGGLIALDRAGEPVLCFNSQGMYRGWMTESETARVKIYA